MKAKLLFFFLFFVFSIAGVFAQNLACQYKEIKETNEFMQVLYDEQGNKYIDIVEVKNIAGGQGRVSFDLINKIPLPVSIKINYDISHSGGSFWPNQEEFQEIEPLETITILNTGSSGILWGSSSVSNIRITYISNDKLEVKAEKRKEEICKLCGEVSCFDDGQNCSSDSECGSRICNIAGICGENKLTDCPEGYKNCNDESCLEVGTKKIGEPYSCGFECKSNFGKEDICATPLKEKILKVLFISITFILLVGIVYFIWTNKNPFFSKNDKDN